MSDELGELEGTDFTELRDKEKEKEKRSLIKSELRSVLEDLIKSREAEEKQTRGLINKLCLLERDMIKLEEKYAKSLQDELTQKTCQNCKQLYLPKHNYHVI